MTRAKKTPQQQEPLRVVTFKSTAAVEQILQQLSQDASDALGWTVSSSAVIRGLIHHAGQQLPAWATSTLHPQIEKEIEQGRVWGKKKRG